MAFEKRYRAVLRGYTDSFEWIQGFPLMIYLSDRSAKPDIWLLKRA